MTNDKTKHGARTERREVKIPIAQLKVGMFVCGLDRDWLETPFKLQGVYVRSMEDIDELSKYCQHVYILVNKPIDIQTKVGFSAFKIIGRKPEEYPLETDFGSEFALAKKASDDQRSFVKGAFSSASKKEGFDYAKVGDTVVNTVNSVIRHPDAMMFMTKLRGQDEYTVEHCMNVCTLSIVFGRKLGLKKRQLVNLGVCGLLHDVGKARVPLEILNKPGSFTKEEFEIMKQHVNHGKDMLSEPGNVLEEAINVAYSHHERLDGRGYPEQKIEDDLSLFTKIVSIVDTFDAITGDRVYAKGLPSSEALRILYENMGTQFDESLVLAFIHTMGVYPSGSVVELVNGAIAIVLESESCPKHLPNVLVVLDSNKEAQEEKLMCLADSVDGDYDRGFLIKSCLTDGCYGVWLKDFVKRGIFDTLRIDTYDV